MSPLPLRADFNAQTTRSAARRSKDGPQARRLLALAAIYDGATRKHFGLRPDCRSALLTNFDYHIVGILAERTGIVGQSEHCCGVGWPSDRPRSATSLTGPRVVRR
jgi:hypothetical protein